jgi:hypothetical protein
VAGAAVEPKSLEEVFIEQKAKKYKFGSTSRNVSGLLLTPLFSKQVCGDLPQAEQRNRLLRLQFELQVEAHKLGIRLPIKNLLDPVCSATSECDQSVASLPDVVFDVDLPVSAVEEAHERPHSLLELIPCKFDSVLSDGFMDAKAKFLSMLCFTLEQKDEINLLCSGQSKSKFWKNHKTGCVTSSIAHQVTQFVVYKKTDAEGLLKKIMFYETMTLHFLAFLLNGELITNH